MHIKYLLNPFSSVTGFEYSAQVGIGESLGWDWCSESNISLLAVGSLQCKFNSGV